MLSVKFKKSRLLKAATENPIWLTIYSDLMTNLMLFFLLMYGMTIMTDEMKKKVVDGLQSKFKPQMTETRVKQVMKRIKEEEAVRQMQHFMVSENLRKYAAVEIDEHRIRIILRTPILYDAGGAKLKVGARTVLAEVATVLKELDRPLVVEGHTDDTPVSSGRYASNWELSLDRSMQVVRFFQDAGVAPENLCFEGYGEWRPLYPNSTELGRMFNRRVEIHVQREVAG